MTSVSSSTSSSSSASTSSSSTSTATSSISSTATSTTLTEADVVEAAYERALEPATELETKLSANETRIAAYQDMQTLLQTLESSLSDLHDSTDTTNDVFSQRAATLSTNTTSSTAEMSATIEPGTATGTHQIVIDQVATAERIASGGVASETASLGYSGTFTIAEAGGTSASISVTAGMSLLDVEDAINNVSATTGVSASILEVSTSSYVLVLTAADTDKAIDLTSTSGGDIPVSLGLLTSSGGYGDELQAAQPAILAVDGVTGITRTSNTISDVLDGVTMKLTHADAASTITMSIGYDTSATETAIANLVTAYNTWRAFVIANQSTNADGTAETTATLFGDSMLRDVNVEIEDALASEVKGNALAAFGISFTSQDELSVNATTLESALQNSYTALQSLFDFSTDISNSALILTSHNGATYSGTFTLNISTTTAGGVSSVDVGGATSLFTISGDLITGVAGTEFAGLSFYYSGGTSATVTIGVSQGIGDQIYQILDGYTNTLTGMLTNEISSLESQDTDLDSEINDITASADDYKNYLITQYGILDSQISENDYLVSLLQTLMKSDSSSG